MKIIGVLGGKGGTGKTFVSVNLALLSSNRGYRVLLVDADVDNPSTKYYLRFNIEKIEEATMFKPLIDKNKCKLCLTCISSCPEHALIYIPFKGIRLFEEICNGCSLCMYICPEKAITEGAKVYGYITYARTNENLGILIGEIKPSERFTINLIVRVLDTTLKMCKAYDLIIIDSPPGINAGIYEIIKTSNILLAVTEPTRLGLSDLKKLVNLILKYNKRPLVILNKANVRGGINEEVKDYVKSLGLDFIEIPYSTKIALKIMKGETIIGSRGFELVEKIFDKILDFIISARS